MSESNDPQSWEDEYESEDMYLGETMHGEGVCVFRKEWCSGGPGGGAGTELGYRWRGAYWTAIDGVGMMGPYDTLAELLKLNDLACITSATTSVDCSELTAGELIRILPIDSAPEDGFLLVNGQRWLVTDEDGIVRADPKT